MIYVVGFIIVAVFIIVFIKKVKSIFKPWKIALIIAGVFIGVFGISAGIYAIKYGIAKSKFKSFDLAELKRQELIIQTIDFNKFIVQGTEVPKKTLTSDYTDELQVYFVKGQAKVLFTDIENLKMNEETSDITTKTLRLDYNNQTKQIPFTIDVAIADEDMYKVVNLESKTINILGFKKDLIKAEMTQREKVEIIKQELKKEFEKQIIDIKGKDLKNNSKKLADSDLYQTFITRIEEIVTSVSDWESVEINFSTKNQTHSEKPKRLDSKNLFVISK